MCLRSWAWRAGERRKQRLSRRENNSNCLLVVSFFLYLFSLWNADGAEN